MRYVVNPFSGQLDSVVGPPASDPFVAPCDCLSSDAVGMCVAISGARVAGRFQIARARIDANPFKRAWGVILRKSGSTTCDVAYDGLIDLTGSISALTPGKLVLVGADGFPTTTLPTRPAVIQSIGLAIDTFAIFVRVEMRASRLSA